jgi:hypothetical protein
VHSNHCRCHDHCRECHLTLSVRIAVFVTDFFDFRDDKEGLVKQFYGPLCAFIGAMKGLEELKNPIVTNILDEYLEQTANAMCRVFNGLSLDAGENGYDSCKEEDEEYFRNGNQYYVLQEAVMKTGSKKKSDVLLAPKCQNSRFLSLILNKLNQSTDHSVKVCTTATYCFAMHVMLMCCVACDCRVPSRQSSRSSQNQRNGTATKLLMKLRPVRTHFPWSDATSTSRTILTT